MCPLLRTILRCLVDGLVRVCWYGSGWGFDGRSRSSLFAFTRDAEDGHSYDEGDDGDAADHAADDGTCVRGCGFGSSSWSWGAGAGS
jgi:hypothetical protein